MSKAFKLQWLGPNVGLSIPGEVARAVGFKPGSFVRLVVMPSELRIRPVAMPCIDDFAPDADADAPDAERQEATGQMMRR